MRKNYFTIHLLIMSAAGLFWGAICQREDGHCMAEKFITARYIWIPYVTLFMLMAITLTFLAATFSGRTIKIEAKPPWFLLVPILLLQPALNARLGSDAVNRRGAEAILAEVSNNPGIQESGNSEKKNREKEIKVFPDGLNHISHIAMNDQDYIGEEVEVNGQAIFTKLLPEETFYLFRFVIYCCAADAVPTGLIVTGYDKERITQDSWYTVKGRIEYVTVDGREYLSLRAEDVTESIAPEYPYENLN